MEPWTFIASFWFTTWLMLIWRTYSISMRMIGKDQKGAYIKQNKRLHFVVYCLGIFIITPFIGWIEKPNKLPLSISDVYAKNIAPNIGGGEKGMPSPAMQKDTNL